MQYQCLPGSCPLSPYITHSCKGREAPSCQSPRDFFFIHAEIAAWRHCKSGHSKVLRVVTQGSCYRVGSNTGWEWTCSLAGRQAGVNHTSKFSKRPALRISQCSKKGRKLCSAEVQSVTVLAFSWLGTPGRGTRKKCTFNIKRISPLAAKNYSCCRITPDCMLIFMCRPVASWSQKDIRQEGGEMSKW